MSWPSLGGCSAKRQRVAKAVDTYTKKPDGDISLDEFEQFALDRKRVLSGIEGAYAGGAKGDERKTRISNLLLQYLPARNPEDLRKDQVSHEILCLAYSRTAELRRWFVRQEERLFRHRLNAQGAEGRAGVLCGLRGEAWKAIEQEEYEGLGGRLMAVFGGRNMNLQESSYSCDNAEYFHSEKAPWTHVYKVKFEEVPELVRGRQVLLRGGDAYVLSRDLDAVASVSFSKGLSDKLAVRERQFHGIVDEEEERLGPLLLALPGADVSRAFKGEGRVTLLELEGALAASAPLCMRGSHGVLKAAHHLKHNARQQYGLFLKGVGVTLEDALGFWRSEFAKGGKTGEEFEKRYGYNFRHQYGQAGSHKNYSPYGCAKVIGASPDAYGATGCPFRTCQAAGLEKRLAGLNLKADAVAAVVGRAKEGHFQEACTMEFEARHALQLPSHGKLRAEGGVQHPNQYFRESREYYKEQEAGDAN
jgi:DNA primase large subunit